jgi:hypothetical protein
MSQPSLAALIGVVQRMKRDLSRSGSGDVTVRTTPQPGSAVPRARISVIVSTYNRERYLELALLGFANQIDPDFEIVVADDGSSPAVSRLIRSKREHLPFPIAHVWHEDQGFRKTRILNHAILLARGDYLLFTDGDCVPRRDLVAVHRQLATPGRFVSGGYLKLTEEISDALTVEDVLEGRVTDPGWLRGRGWRPGLRGFRMTPSLFRARLYDRITTTRPHLQGNNASAWLSDVLAANGFDNDMGYGSEDRALGVRLRNAGVRPIQARHRAITMHLEHPRPYAGRAAAQANGERVREMRRTGMACARDAIAELSNDPTLRVDAPYRAGIATEVGR